MDMKNLQHEIAGIITFFTGGKGGFRFFTVSLQHTDKRHEKMKRKRFAIVLTAFLTTILVTDCLAKRQNAPMNSTGQKAIYQPMKTIYATLPSYTLPLRYPGTVTGMKPIRKDQLDKDQLLPPDSMRSLPLRLFYESWDRLEDIMACRLTDKAGTKAILLRGYVRLYPTANSPFEYFYLLLLDSEWRIKDCRQVYKSNVLCGKSRPPMSAVQELSIGTNHTCMVTTTYYNLDTKAIMYKHIVMLHVGKDGNLVEEERTVLY